MSDLLSFRYSDTDSHLHNFQRPCNHNTKSFKCGLLKNCGIKRVRAKFYEEPIKTVQDQKLILCRLLNLKESGQGLNKMRKRNQKVYKENITFVLKETIGMSCLQRISFGCSRHNKEQINIHSEDQSRG